MRQFRNFKEIQFIWHGEWSDPELIYKNKSFNYWDIKELFYNDFKDLLYNSYEILTEERKEKLYKYFLIKHHDNLLSLLDEIIEGVY